MQYFKGDADDLKMDGVHEPTISAITLQKDAFYEGAYETAPLGDMIFDTGRSPLSNAIARDVFRLAFKEIFEAFVDVGTFEAYITVFKKIFGDDVGIAFTVPAPGKLTITITATGVEESLFVAREIVDNAYELDPVVTSVDGDNIVFQTILGFQSQYELEQMLFEMVPGGIFTTITLTLGA